MLILAAGLSCYRVAEWLGEDPRTIQRWVHRFEAEGFAGRQEGERPGRPVRVTEAQVEAVGRDLRRSPRTWGYQQNLWDGKLLAHHLANSPWWKWYFRWRPR